MSLESDLDHLTSGCVDVVTPESLKEKLKRVASHMLEAGPHDLEFRDGKIGVKGASGLEVSIAEVATQAHFFRPSLPDDPHLTSGLDASYTYDDPLATLPKSDSDFGIFYPIMGHMCHMPVVAVDIKTGQVTFLDYVAVHDCGTMVNPMTVDGHVRGGTAHGIGTALLEQFEYDKDGQPQQISFQDYPMPRVLNLPPAGANRPFGDIVALHRIWREGSGARAAAWWRGRVRDRRCVASASRAYRQPADNAGSVALAHPRGRDGQRRPVAAAA